MLCYAMLSLPRLASPYWVKFDLFLFSVSKATLFKSRIWVPLQFTTLPEWPNTGLGCCFGGLFCLKLSCRPPVPSRLSLTQCLICWPGCSPTDSIYFALFTPSQEPKEAGLMSQVVALPHRTHYSVLLWFWPSMVHTCVLISVCFNSVVLPFSGHFSFFLLLLKRCDWAANGSFHSLACCWNHSAVWTPPPPRLPLDPSSFAESAQVNLDVSALVLGVNAHGFLSTLLYSFIPLRRHR